MRDDQAEFRKLDVLTLGVNPASIASHEKYVEGFKFNFPLMSDPDRAVAKAYHALKPDGKGIQRTVYLIARDGTVAFAQRGAPPTDTILAPLG